MQTFSVYTLATAPEKSKSALQALQKTFGMIPNLIGTMAASPVLINSLVGMFGNVHGASFSEAQVQTLLLTDAVTNRCDWAVAFHSTLALNEGIAPADVQAMRDGHSPKDPQLAPLSTLARTLIEKRGQLGDQDIDRFIKAGYDKELLLEAIAAVAASTITNYVGNVTRPPLETAFQAQAWQPGEMEERAT
ncbi:MAG TPA: hypothetical protein VN662_03125 [Rhodanobacteraceae bacterium]|nr:hypothetical protein [Rhodanobacteraceae bacterium]